MDRWCNWLGVVWAFIVNFLLSSHYICQIPASYTSPASNISKRPITPGLYSACYFKIGTQKWRTCLEVQHLPSSAVSLCRCWWSSETRRSWRRPWTWARATQSAPAWTSSRTGTPNIVQSYKKYLRFGATNMIYTHNKSAMHVLFS